MKILTLLRHAKSTWDDPVARDFDRPLNPRGRRAAHKVGAEMKTAGAKLKSLDQDFQKALLKVARSQRTAYMTVGHGEVNEQTANARFLGDRDAGVALAQLETTPDALAALLAGLDREKLAEYGELYRRLGAYPYDQDPLRPGWTPTIPNNRWADSADARVPEIGF